MKLTRSYQLKIYPNYLKSEDLRYSAYRYGQYLQHFVTQLFYRPWIRFFSTKGMGSLANQAQQEAMNIVRGVRQKLKSDNPHTDCPKILYDSCPGKIEKSDNTKFDYWINLNSQWKNKVKIPVKSHRKLNDKLKKGWKLSDHVQFYKSKAGNWYARVFVIKEIDKIKPQNRSLGVDVGLQHGVARSDGYLGKNLSKLIKIEKFKQAERQRQGHRKKPFKTSVKQLLDHEVNLALGRSKKDGLNLVTEHPKVLSNLKIDRWARSYFANRASTRALEEEVYVTWINPAYTSITCSECGHIDKQSRVNQSEFICTGCGNTVNADINAAINIARKGQERIVRLSAKVPANTYQERKV